MCYSVNVGCDLVCLIDFCALSCNTHLVLRYSAMDDNEYDSGEDLFITQSNFKSDTQDAAGAADFFETDFNLSLDLDAPEVVQYWDFSHDASNVHDNEPVPPADLLSNPVDAFDTENVIIGEEPAVPLLPNLEEDGVSDEVLSGALDAALDSVQETNRFAQPVSDSTVQESSAKGYVSLHLHNVTFQNISKHIEYGL